MHRILKVKKFYIIKFSLLDFLSPGSFVIVQENAVAILLYPESLDNPLWASNMKQLALFNELPPEPPINNPGRGAPSFPNANAKSNKNQVPRDPRLRNSNSNSTTNLLPPQTNPLSKSNPATHPQNQTNYAPSKNSVATGPYYNVPPPGN
jgi:hypothetical protein